MNRRHFLRNLALGAASLPVVAKALANAKPVLIGVDVASKPDVQKIWMCSTPSGKWSHNPAWENAEYRVDFITPASERRTAERIAKAMSGQRPYDPARLREMGLEWHRGQTVRT
jgi:hypothetical protein